MGIAMLSFAMLHCRLLLLASLLLLPLAVTGCNQSDQLSVTGEASVQMSADRVERFAFDAQTALEEDTRSAALEGVIAGHCVLDQSALTAVDVSVSRPGAVGGFKSFRVSAGLSEGGLVSAVVDGIELNGESADATCTVSTLYADFDAETAGVRVDCELTDGTVVYPSAAELQFANCLVR